MAGLLDSEEAGDGSAPPAPFMKWVGGKRQLLPELFARLPKRGVVEELLIR